MSSIKAATARKTLGKQLRMLRKATKKTVQEIAKEAGILPATLVKIEDGKANFRLLTLEKIGKVYGLSSKELLESLPVERPK